MINNIDSLLTGNAAIDYINITTIIVNSVALFASLVLIIFFILNIVLKIMYKNLQQMINSKTNTNFILYPTGANISLEQFYNDSKLSQTKQQIDDEFQKFSCEMKNHEKKLLIFKQILNILSTLIKYSIKYKKFNRLINSLRIIYCCFSTNKSNNNCALYFNNQVLTVKILDVDYLQITINANTKTPICFNVRVSKKKCLKLCPNQKFDANDEATIKQFITTFNEKSKCVYYNLKREIFLFDKQNWSKIDDTIIENVKGLRRYKKLNDKYWIVRFKNFHI